MILVEGKGVYKTFGIFHNSTRQLFLFYKISFNEPLLAEDVSRIDDWLRSVISEEGRILGCKCGVSSHFGVLYLQNISFSHDLFGKKIKIPIKSYLFIQANVI